MIVLSLKSFFGKNFQEPFGPPVKSSGNLENFSCHLFGWRCQAIDQNSPPTARATSLPGSSRSLGTGINILRLNNSLQIIHTFIYSLDHKNKDEGGLSRHISFLCCVVVSLAFIGFTLNYRIKIDKEVYFQPCPRMHAFIQKRTGFWFHGSG